jgi:hypothetical protein
MSGIKHELPSIPATLVACDFHRPIQDANRRIGGDERKRAANSPRRNGVIVEIEPDVNGLSRAHGFDAIGVERVQRECEQSRLFFGNDLLDRAPILARPAAPMRDLVAPRQCLAVAFGEGGKGPAGPEGIAHIPDSRSTPPFSFPARSWQGRGAK